MSAKIKSFLLPMVLVLSLIYSCKDAAPTRVLMEELVRPNFEGIAIPGVYHKDGKPYTGIALTYWTPNQINDEYEMKDGEILKHTHYHRNGSEYEVYEIVNGEWQYNAYFKNGQLNVKKTEQARELSRIEEEQRILDSIASAEAVR